MFLSFNVWAKPYQRIQISKKENILFTNVNNSQLENDSGAGVLATAYIAVMVVGMVVAWMLVQDLHNAREENESKYD